MDKLDWFEIENVFTQDDLRRIRRRTTPPARPTRIENSVSYSAREPEYEDAVLFHLALSSEGETPPPPWMIGFSKQFKKDTSALDRKLMGRILEVLEKVSDYCPPFQAQGDTFKPLSGELEGCWRYRIGDSRLILQPKVDRGQLNVLAFGARGSVYED